MSNSTNSGGSTNSGFSATCGCGFLAVVFSICIAAIIFAIGLTTGWLNLTQMIGYSLGAFGVITLILLVGGAFLDSIS